MTTIKAAVWAALCTFACGGAAGSSSDTAPAAAPAPAAADDTYGPLEYGADYASWAKMNTEPFPSKTHGGRYVDVYVNDVGTAAFQNKETPFPPGSVIVKTSFETANGTPTDVAGPVFVMRKLEPGSSPQTDDWWYALHWEDVPESWRSRMGGKSQVYWRSPSKKVGYCVSCHEKYNRGIGGVPRGKRAWE